MHAARVVTSLCVLAMAAVFSAPATAADAIAPPADDETLIYILREGGGGKVWVAVNAETVGRLQNRSWEVIRTKAGLVTVNIAVTGIPTAAIALDDRPGETVYLKWKVPDTQFTEVDERDAQEFLARQKRTKSMDEVQENNEQIRVLMGLARMGFDLMRPAQSRKSPDENHAVLTLFRPRKKAHMITGVWGERGYVGTLEAGQGIEILLPPGEHYFLTGSIGTALLRARVEAGQHYYAWLDIGSRTQLKAIGPEDEEKAREWMQGLEFVELDAAKITARVRDREKIVLAHLSERAAGARAGDKVHQNLGPEHALP